MVRDLFHRVMANDKAFWLAQHLFPFTVRKYRDLLQRHVAVRRSQRLLDVGCGVGDYARYFPCRYVGIDVNPLYIQYARDKFPEAEFHVMDCTRLDLDDGSFDEVVTIASFHHLTDQEVIQTVSECIRVLKAGGRLHVVDAVLPLDDTSRFKRWLFLNDRGRHQRTFASLLALIGSRFAIEHSEAETGLLHDTCYLRISSAIPM